MKSMTMKRITMRKRKINLVEKAMRRHMATNMVTNLATSTATLKASKMTTKTVKNYGQMKIASMNRTCRTRTQTRFSTKLRSLTQKTLKMSRK